MDEFFVDGQNFANMTLVERNVDSYQSRLVLWCYRSNLDGVSSNKFSLVRSIYIITVLLYARVYLWIMESRF